MATSAHRYRDTRSRTEKKQAVADDGVVRVTLSFYRYVSIAAPEDMRDRLHATLHKFSCLGRIYVAREGINAQMNVPQKNWRVFDSFVQSIPEFAGVPYKTAIEETNTASFYKLSVKVKDKIVADGLDDSTFDVTDTGEYLTAEEMNAYIDDPDAIVVDMRNGYESEVGHFERAVTPDTDTFREELAVVPEQLRLHKNKKIALYCTGGIRCEKASAWLRHCGFTDVRHLKGGIIDYARQVEEAGLPNRFRGKNFVFDERMGERVQDEMIARCHLCGTTKWDTHVHCTNDACHILFIGCPKCLKKKQGYCSYRCIAFDRLPRRVKKWFTKNNHQKSIAGFKKHRMRHTDTY